MPNLKISFLMKSNYLAVEPLSSIDAVSLNALL